MHQLYPIIYSFKRSHSDSPVSCSAPSVSSTLRSAIFPWARVFSHTRHAHLVFKMSHRKPDIEATEPNSSSISSKSDFGTAQHHEHMNSQPRQTCVAAKLRNPLAGLSEEQVIANVDAWCVEKGLQEHQEAFRKGALIARVGQREDGFEYVSQLSAEEKDLLRYEINHRWSQPFMLYFLVVLCAGSAIVQGMDQTAVNGAQVSLSSSQTNDVRMLTSVGILLPGVQHRRRPGVASWSTQWCTIPLLLPHWLLVKCSAQQILWPSRHYFHLVYHFFHHWHMDGSCG